MKRFLLVAILAFIVTGLSAQQYSWTSVPMDGSRTGCTAPSDGELSSSLGTFRRGRYIAPNGRSYRACSGTARTAKAVAAAQPKMARVKEVIAYSPEAMSVAYPEGPLSNWFVDLLMDKVSRLSGKKVDVGIANFGGIRIDMPQGDVILDDMLSMFPFRNQLVYLEHKGSEIRRILEDMAASGFQVLGGVRAVVQDGKLLSVEIGGEPLCDDKVYGVATISFLLYGGDGLSLADNARTMVRYDDVDIIDAVLEFVRAETVAGRPLVSKADGRVVIR